MDKACVGGVLESARAQLAAYTARFASRLSAKNLMYVRQLTTFIERLQGAAATGAHSVQVMTINKFLMAVSCVLV
jgi:3-oxoacyl-(acyl-carrier-protein) synthase